MSGNSSSSRSLARVERRAALNGYDANVLEEPLKIKERRGGSVTAVALGAESVKDSLRRAIAMGADKAIHIKGSSSFDAEVKLRREFLLRLCGGSAI
jgi:electron transfer flavoprotein alpha/beta subunit